MVGFGKLGSWFLLLLISYALVVAIKKPVLTRQKLPGSP